MSNLDYEDDNLGRNTPPESEEDTPSSDPDSDDPHPFDCNEGNPTPPDPNGDGGPVARDDMKMNSELIRMLKEATLESQISSTELETFCNPQKISFSPSEDPDLLLSISNFVANLNASQDIYTRSRLNI